MDDFFEKEKINTSEVKKVMRTLLSDVDKIAAKEKEKKIQWIIGVISHIISLISHGAIGKLEAFRKISMLLKLVSSLKLDNVPIIRDLLYSLKETFDRKYGVRFDLFGMLDGLFYGSGGRVDFLFEDISAEDLMKKDEIKEMFYDSLLWGSQVKTADEGKQVLSESLEEINSFLEDEDEHKKEKVLEEQYLRQNSYNNGQHLFVNGAVSSQIQKRKKKSLEDNSNINFTI